MMAIINMAYWGLIAFAIVMLCSTDFTVLIWR